MNFIHTARLLAFEFPLIDETLMFGVCSWYLSMQLNFVAHLFALVHFRVNTTYLKYSGMKCLLL
jgi:hypothetical protein